MKRVLLFFLGFVLAMLLFASLGMVFSPRLRLVGVVGLSIAVLLTIAWVLAVRRSRAARQLRAVPQRVSARAGDEPSATAWRDQPSWRDDVDGRVGPPL